MAEFVAKVKEWPKQQTERIASPGLDQRPACGSSFIRSKSPTISFFGNQNAALADAIRQRDVAAQGVAPQLCLEGHGLRATTRSPSRTLAGG